MFDILEYTEHNERKYSALKMFALWDMYLRYKL